MRRHFNDVAGIDETKNELVEIVDFLKDPPKYTRLAARLRRGCCGPVQIAPGESLPGPLGRIRRREAVQRGDGGSHRCEVLRIIADSHEASGSSVPQGA
jgi:hypothetical protein